MTRRNLARYIDDMLAGRQPKPFTPDEFEAAQLRTAIDLTAAREDAGEPRPEFVDSLKARMAAEMSSDTAPLTNTPPPKTRMSATRRQVIVGTSAAATAAVAGVSVDRLVVRPRTDDQQAADSELVPTDGSWQTVTASGDLPEGAVHAFDLGSVSGFVRRVNGRSMPCQACAPIRLQAVVRPGGGRPVALPVPLDVVLPGRRGRDACSADCTEAVAALRRS